MAFNNWYAENPVGIPSLDMIKTDSFSSWSKSALGYAGQMNRHMAGEAHIMGRQLFASNIAAGGLASTIFAPNAAEAFKAPFRRKVSVGSDAHLQNLRKLQALHPESKSIQKAIAKAEKTKPSWGIGGKLAGTALGGVFIGGSMLAAPKGLENKAQAGIRATAETVGFAAGSRLGMAAGAAAGTAVMPVVGTLVGAAVGWLAGGVLGSQALGEMSDFVTGIPINMVKSQQNRRSLSWGNNTAPFRTAAAHTMRQQSLSLMNRGQMSARSLLGQEAVFVHS